MFLTCKCATVPFKQETSDLENSLIIQKDIMPQPKQTEKMPTTLKIYKRLFNKRTKVNDILQ